MRGNYVANNIIHAVTFVLTAAFFWGFCIELKTSGIMQKIDAGHMVLSFVLALVVQIWKALRLYILLFGKDFSFKEYLRQYAKTAFVNIMVPLKAGELYRGYCIGQMVGAMADGYLIVLFDRFTDTLALISLVIVSAVFGKSQITVTYAALTVALLLLVAAYLLFRPLYLYWNQFLIFKKKSRNTLAALEVLKVCNASFHNISTLVKGRFALLYAASLLAWMADIGGFFMRPASLAPAGISAYLANILTGDWDAYNLLYTLACLGVFTLFLVLGLMIGRKDNGSIGRIR